VRSHSFACTPHTHVRTPQGDACFLAFTHGIDAFNVASTEYGKCANICPVTIDFYLKDTWKPIYKGNEAQNLLGCTAVFLIECRQTFQRCVLPPSSEMITIQLRTRQYIPEDSELHIRRRENLKSLPIYNGITRYFFPFLTGLISYVGLLMRESIQCYKVNIFMNVL
jgi:hypothetical protein